MKSHTTAAGVAVLMVLAMATSAAGQAATTPITAPPPPPAPPAAQEATDVRDLPSLTADPYKKISRTNFNLHDYMLLPRNDRIAYETYFRARTFPPHNETNGLRRPWMKVDGDRIWHWGAERYREFEPVGAPLTPNYQRGAWIIK